MKILILNGPNMNMLGRREADQYGRFTLDDIKLLLQNLAKNLSVDIDMYQSNIEGELVTKIQQAPDEGYAGIVINPGAYGHTSIALRDAFKAAAITFVEVHISNVYAREEFRHRTYLSDIAGGVVIGFGAQSYLLGLRGLVDVLRSRQA